MYTLIDLHCHMLFGVDDGATDFEVTKKMLEIAYNDGIRAICLTPHFKIYHFEDDEEIKRYNDIIIQNFEAIKEYSKEHFPNLELYIGNEIMYHNDICESISSKKCRFLNKSKYILVEFRPSASIYDIKNAISNLTRKGFTPIIAHIERYSAFASDFSFLNEIKASGALLQVNANSVTKFKFGKSSRLIHKALKNHLVDIIATDAHDEKAIIPCLSKALKKIEKQFGEEYAKKLFHDNPLSIINND